MSEKILDIKDERLSFFTPAGEVKALNGVSFTMNQGDVLGIVGESGSGKSVTAYSVMGLTAYPGKLVGGKVWFNGHEIENMKEKDFRKIRGNPCATTMCTGNLRSGTELLFHAVQDRDPTARRRGLQYYAIILLFILGAFLGVWCTEQWRSRAVLVCCGLLVVVFSAMFLKSGEEALEV